MPPQGLVWTWQRVNQRVNESLLHIGSKRFTSLAKTWPTALFALLVVQVRLFLRLTGARRHAKRLVGVAPATFAADWSSRAETPGQRGPGVNKKPEPAA